MLDGVCVRCPREVCAIVNSYPFKGKREEGGCNGMVWSVIMIGGLSSNISSSALFSRCK